MQGIQKGQWLWYKNTPTQAIMVGDKYIIVYPIPEVLYDENPKLKNADGYIIKEGDADLSLTEATN